MQSPDASRPTTPPIRFGSGGWWVGPGFLALAAWFVFGSELEALPDLSAPRIHKAHISTAPRRTVLDDPPVMRIAGFDRTCMECHRVFESGTPRDGSRLQHGHIELSHGAHDSCLRCHDNDDRDRLALQDGTTIPYTQVDTLCGECHRSVHHDWSRGMHGRTNGFWDSSRGEVHRLTCTECHDPHAPRGPAMDPISPLPGPQTLRMGHQEHTPHHEPSEDPLIRATENR